MALPASGPLALTDIQTEFGGANPIGMNEYYAGGGLVPAGTSGTYGAVPSSGALSVQNFYGTSNFVPVYIEEVFSTYLYAGASAQQSIYNDINLSANGGLVWIKNRTNANSHYLLDTARGIGGTGTSYYLSSNNTNSQGDFTNWMQTDTTGFTLLSGSSGTAANATGYNYVSWTFRKQPKFFDIVTYTGDGSAPRNISHNLGSVPGCIMIKRTDDTGTWTVYHSGIGNTKALFLNATAAADTNSAYWNNTTPTSSVFTLGGTFGDINANGATYVAYLFAHNAGGFGLTGSDNVITCGSFTAAASITDINLGYEPQWLLIKRTDGTGNWQITDSMRTWSNPKSNLTLFPNLTNGETNPNTTAPSAVGFSWESFVGQSYIYIAIRRGPMKVPTSGTSVFQPATFISTAARQTMGSLPVVDMFFGKRRDSSGTNWGMSPRLTQLFMSTNTTGAQDSFATGYGSSAKFDLQNGSSMVSSGSGDLFLTYNLKRSPSFFDVVCYTGNSTANTQISHNLGVTPELMIVKNRTSNGYGWLVYSAALGATKYLFLNGVDAPQTSSSAWSNTAPTSSVFTVGTSGGTNTSPDNYVAYLFATCAGVSKVGSYTGTSALQTINCGFTSGSRFVLIKRTDSTGGWYVWDSARGITAGNDPYLFVNNTDAEVTGTNYVDTDTTGFKVTAAAPAGINESGGSYIFLAIA